MNIQLSANDIIILNHTKSIRECVGNSVLISVSAYSKSGNTISFQWFKDSKILNDEISPILELPSLKHNQSGTYYCQITNGVNDTILTDPATIYALLPTSITKEPEDVKVGLENETVTLEFDAHVSGLGIVDAVRNGEYVKIQWFRVDNGINTKLHNNDIYDGVNSNILSINTNNLQKNGLYFAEIEGKCNKEETKTVNVIKEINLLAISISGFEACEGNYESLKSFISNPNNYNLEYQWYKDGKPIQEKENFKGIFSDELKFEPIYYSDTGKYKLKVTIKGTKFSEFSNEVFIKVGNEPVFVCLRMDTLIDVHTPEYFSGKVENSIWINIFYKSNAKPIYFEIFKNGQLIASRHSDSSVFSLGNISYLECLFNNKFIPNKKDSSSYYVIAYNDCGIAYSDTISLMAQSLCDPFNQFHKLCLNEPISIFLDYQPKIPLNELKIVWESNKDSHFNFETPHESLYYTATKDRLELTDLKFLDEWRNNASVSYFDLRYRVHRSKDGIGLLNYDEFCCFYLKIADIPNIKIQPNDKTLIFDSQDTVFQITFDNDFDKNIEVELYFFTSILNTPKLIDVGIPQIGKLYNHIKKVNYEDAGYYYAVSRYSITNDSIICNVTITDTIKLTVIPKGIVTGVNELNFRFSILPNPANDYILINLSKNSIQPIAEDKVQVFDLLGLEKISELIPPMTSTHLLNVERLPVGVYFIRLGTQVEKFVKI
ncbi:MAG: T9SS type A sorting domain-containing protein [Candidatus Kapabacteria bacterium]|nr:T9SS type A sorting domain-containing protein [Candidatus Kapabacteria bacterium]